MDGVSLYLVKVLLLSSLGLGPLLVKTVLTYARALSEILAFSSLTARASSHHVNSPFLARSSSTTITNIAIAARPEDEGGGSDLHKAYIDKSAMHQVTSQPTVRDNQNLNVSRHASIEHQPPSSSDGRW
jgi:hypothetical protein